MKKFIGLALILIVVATGGILYLEHDANRISTPLQPSTVETPVKAPVHTVPSAHTEHSEPTNHTHNEPTKGEEATTIMDEQEDSNSTRKGNVDTHHQHDDYNWRTAHNPTRKSAPFSRIDQHSKAGSQKGTHFAEMSTDEQADFLRDSWIQMFGDIPAVHTASEYFRKVVKQERMTIDEAIAGVAASHELFPKAGHNQLLEYYKTLKADGVPFINSEGNFQE